MTIDNQTKYDTKQLRKIFTLCLNEVKKTDRVDILRTKVVYHKGNSWVGGSAWRYNIVMKIPSPEKCKVSERGIADTFIHEIGHCLFYQIGKVGNHHRNNDTIEQCYKNWMNSIFGDRYDSPKVLQLKVEKPKPVIDKQLTRYESAKINLQVALTRLKRAKTLFQKWNGKVKYYEVVFANKPKDK